jgi:hypothetical protein
VVEIDNAINWVFRGETAMKLQRLVEMIREDSKGAEEWPVLFASYKQNSAGEWHEVEGVRQPIISVEVEEPAKEVLLITDSDRPPLSLATLVEKLARLLSCHSEYTVDCCETPIVLDGGGTFHIDVPIVGAGRDEKNRCYLVVYTSKASN